jgi:hypothetical protein
MPFAWRGGKFAVWLNNQYLVGSFGGCDPGTISGMSNLVATLFKPPYGLFANPRPDVQIRFLTDDLLWVKHTPHHAAAHQKAGKSTTLQDPWGNKVQ